MIKTNLLRRFLGLIAFGALSFTSALCWASPGQIYETNGEMVIIFQNPGATPVTFVDGLGNPKGLVFDGAGHVFIADASRGSIVELNVLDGKGGNYVTGLSSPVGLAFDRAGSLYIGEAGNGNITKYTREGAKTTFAFAIGVPAALTFDANGFLYVSDFKGGGSIFKFAPDGTKTTFATGLSLPAGLAFDSAGNLFVAESGTGTIFKFTPAGSKSTFVTGLERPYGIVFDTSGNLVVADNANGETSRFTPAGVKSVIFKSDFNTPQFVALEPAAHQLLNISTRGLVQTGDDVLIAGFIVGGNGPIGTTIVVRALGPSLAAAGVANPLQDPILEVRDSSGNLIASNDNWQDATTSKISATGLAPTDPRESGLQLTVGGGTYTAIVRGAGDTTGTAVVEVYNLQ